MLFRWFEALDIHFLPGHAPDPARSPQPRKTFYTICNGFLELAARRSLGRAWMRQANPVRFILTAGQVHDILQAENLISGLSFDKLLADPFGKLRRL